VLGVLCGISLLLSGCESPDGSPNSTATGALVGGALGVASGALIGGHHHAAEGALIGGAIGAVTGGLVGQGVDQDRRERLRQQAPATYARVEQVQPLGIPDVKALAQAGIGDQVILSQIHNSHSVFRMTSAEIIDLKNSGVSETVIDYMINTATSATVSQPAVVVAPPPPPQETVVIAPGPGYVWAGGEWVWNGRWVWVSGHWLVPPRPNTIWIRGYWVHGHNGYHRVGGHWR